MKNYTFLLSFVLLTFFTNTIFSQTLKGLDIYGEAEADQSGVSVSMPDANTVAIGAASNDDNGVNTGTVKVYEWNGSVWNQKGIDLDGESEYDYSGYSVCMPDANTIAIGAHGNDGSGINAGQVRIYEWNGTTWNQKGLDIDGEADDDHSGFSVSMPDANTVAIGARENDDNGSNAGHVRIYEWNGTTWNQKGADLDGEAAGDLFGVSVSMPDANTIAIGANGNDGIGADAGHVRIFEWNGTSWDQKGIDIDGEAAGDLSGISVSMPNENTVAIGANANDGIAQSAGHVRIYEWIGGTWIQKGLDIDGEAEYDQSGARVSMPDVNTIAIGAYTNSENSYQAGHVRVYEWDNSSWVQKGVDIDGEGESDQCGFSVCMPDANTVAIGAPNNDNIMSNAGQVRLFIFEPESVLVNSITVQGEAGVSTISTLGGTLQMEATVLPMNADDDTYTWSIANGTGSAMISVDGLLTAMTDGTVTVIATANDASGVIGTTEITISNQTSSFSSLQSLPNISIYPNPASNQIFINTEVDIEAISIIDVLGKTVRTVIEPKTNIRLDDLTNGIYFLQIQIGETIVNRKILKE